MIKLSATDVKILGFLRDYPGAAPREVAKFLWPDSPAWKKSSNCGPNGSTRGIWMAGNAGRLLWGLHERGLALRDDGRWHASAKGRAALTANLSHALRNTRGLPNDGGSFHQ